MNLFKRTFLTIAVFSLCTFSHAIFSEELGKKYQKIEKDYKKLAEKRGFISTESDISHEVCRLFEEEILDLQNLSPSKKTKKEAEIRKALGAKHTNGFTPIFYAVLTKNAPLVRKMIDYGADVNETDSQKRMPLLFRAINEESPDYETVKAILSAKKCNADFRYTSNQYVNVTPLLLACTKKNPEIIKIVLEKARDIDVRGKIPYGNIVLELTPLQYLCCFYDKATNFSVSQLLEKGADANSAFSVGDESKTPLFFAATSQNEEFFHMILKKVSKIDERISVRANFLIFSGTVFDYICAFCPSDIFAWKCAERLIEKGTDINDTAFEGKNELTPLLFLCRQYKSPHIEEKITHLLEKGANPDKMCVIDGWKLSPFHFVTKYADYYESNLFKTFRDAGGDMNKTDSDNFSSFDYKKNHIKNFADKIEFSYLQKGSADFSDASENDWASKTTDSSLTVLHLALENSDDEIALKIMRENLVDWKTPDKNGKNAFDYAVMFQRSLVLDFFLDENIKITSSLYTLLDASLRSGNTAYLKKFLAVENFSSCNAALSSGDEAGAFVYAALSQASEKNKDSVLEALFLFKEKISFSALNKKIRPEGKTPLLLSIERGDEAAATWLLEAGAEISENSDEKKAVFLLNRQKVMRYLLDKKIPLASAIFAAIDNELSGNESFLPQFLALEKDGTGSAFSKTTQIDGSSYGAVTYCAKKDSAVPNAPLRKKVLAELFEAGFSPDEKVRGGSANGDTALLICAKEKNADVFSFLAEHGASLSAQNEGSEPGKTALFYALENGDRKITAEILGRNDFSAKDIVLRDKTTLLMYFAKYATFEELNEVISKIVFENPSAIERRDGSGMTPFLYAAAFQSDYRIMALLRMYGADVNAKDNHGQSARAIAAKHQNNDVIKRLEDYGVYQ